MYDDYDDNLEDFELDNIKDSELDVFDNREVDCYEVTKWDWSCLECGCVNTEHRKPRLGTIVECVECNAVFSAVCE